MGYSFALFSLALKVAAPSVLVSLVTNRGIKSPPFLLHFIVCFKFPLPIKEQKEIPADSPFSDAFFSSSVEKNCICMRCPIKSLLSYGGPSSGIVFFWGGECYMGGRTGHHILRGTQFFFPTRLPSTHFSLPPSPPYLVLFFSLRPPPSLPS